MTIASAILLLATIACTDFGEDLDLPRSSLILYGRVTDLSGAGIGGARIDLTYNPHLCSTSARNRDDVTTTPDGRYREVFDVLPEDRGCVHLRVQANGFARDSAARMDGVFHREPPFDSVQTNFTLRPR
jgi:hypothetical protein